MGSGVEVESRVGGKGLTWITAPLFYGQCLMQTGEQNKFSFKTHFLMSNHWEPSCPAARWERKQLRLSELKPWLAVSVSLISVAIRSLNDFLVTELNFEWVIRFRGVPTQPEFQIELYSSFYFRSCFEWRVRPMYHWQVLKVPEVWPLNLVAPGWCPSVPEVLPVSLQTCEKHLQGQNPRASI